jgi:hypothetical protein
MHGLYLLFWVQEKGVSPAILAAGLAAGDLAVMLFELPTGWVADRWGPRTSLIIGSIVQVTGIVTCWLTPGIVSVVAGTLIIAFGDAFRSGADQALLYRTCAALHHVSEFRRIEARAHAVTLIALVVLVVSGGAIVARWGFAAGWITEALLCSVGVVLAVMMATPPAAGDLPDAAKAEPANQSWKRLTSLGLFRVILPASVIGAAASAASFVAQTGSTSPGFVTWLVAATALAEAAGSLVGSRPFRLFRSSYLLVLTFVALGAVFVGPILVGAAALVLAAISGAAHPARAVAIQTFATDAIRARAVSLANACDMAASSIALSLAGIIGSQHRPRQIR